MQRGFFSALLFPCHILHVWFQLAVFPSNDLAPGLLSPLMSQTEEEEEEEEEECSTDREGDTHTHTQRKVPHNPCKYNNKNRRKNRLDVIMPTSSSEPLI